MLCRSRCIDLAGKLNQIALFICECIWSWQKILMKPDCEKTKMTIALAQTEKIRKPSGVDRVVCIVKYSFIYVFYLFVSHIVYYLCGIEWEHHIHTKYLIILVILYSYFILIKSEISNKSKSRVFSVSVVSSFVSKFYSLKSSEILLIRIH